MIYVDNAATTRLSLAARKAMLSAWELCGNPSAVHAAGRQAAGIVAEAREDISALLGCAPKELIFTSGGTEADNQALRCGAALGAREGKRHIVSTAIEHHAVLKTLEALEGEGFEVELLLVDAQGIVSPEALRAALRPDTCLVSVMFANNEIGTLQPIAELSAICRQAGVLFHTDAVQAVGHVPVDLRALGVDMLSLSAHKFGGPQGVGALYVRHDIPVAKLLHGGVQERGRRAGTENVAGIVGMAAALQDACRNLAENTAAVTALRDRLTAGLLNISGAELNGSATRRLPGNVNISFAGVRGEELLLLLDEAGICASLGSACSSGSLDPSHVILALGKSPEMAQAALRLTLSAENTPEEVEEVIRVVASSVERLRAQ